MHLSFSRRFIIPIYTSLLTKSQFCFQNMQNVVNQSFVIVFVYFHLKFNIWFVTFVYNFQNFVFSLWRNRRTRFINNNVKLNISRLKTKPPKRLLFSTLVSSYKFADLKTEMLIFASQRTLLDLSNAFRKKQF